MAHNSIVGAVFTPHGGHGDFRVTVKWSRVDKDKEYAGYAQVLGDNIPRRRPEGKSWSYDKTKDLIPIDRLAINPMLGMKLY